MEGLGVITGDSVAPDVQPTIEATANTPVTRMIDPLAIRIMDVVYVTSLDPIVDVQALECGPSGSHRYDRGTRR
jgi:hypothetical protein